MCEAGPGAGTVNSAKLLMLSGVGPAEHLQSLGIQVQTGTTGTNWYKLVQIGTTCTNWYNLYKLVQLVQIGTNWYKLVQTGTNWYTLVQTGANWYKLVQTYEVEDEPEADSVLYSSKLLGQKICTNIMFSY